MTLRLALALLAAAIAALAAPARAADPPPRSDCSRAAEARERPAESRRVATDDQLCLRLDRDRDGRAIEFFGGKIDANRPRSGNDPELERSRDEIERQDGFFGLRLRMPY
jgi:hypothetical protein